MTELLWQDLHRPCKVGPEAPVPILQWQWEFEKLLDLYDYRRPKMVLEIGSYHGGSLYHFLKHATPGATIVSVDQPPADTKQQFQEWSGDKLLVQITGRTDDTGVLTQVTGMAPFDWVFIDAGHSYSEVSADWRNYSILVEHGIVALHDIVPGPGLEVYLLWREIQARGYITQEIVCDHVADWGGIGVVYL